MVVLPNILFHIQVVSIGVIEHVYVSESVFQFLVIVVGDGGEGIEKIGINLFRLGHCVPLLLLRLFVSLSHYGPNYKHIG